MYNNDSNFYYNNSFSNYDKFNNEEEESIDCFFNSIVPNIVEPPELKLELPDPIDTQLQNLRDRLINNFSNKPIEGLTSNYILSQRIFSFLSSLIFAISEIIEDSSQQSKASVEDLVMRMQKNLILLTTPCKTKCISGSCNQVEKLISNAKEIKKAINVSYEDPYYKNCLWGLASVIRSFTTGKILGVKSNITSKSLLLDNYTNFVMDVYNKEFSCIDFNIGTYNNSCNNKLFERKVNPRTVCCYNVNKGPLDQYINFAANSLPKPLPFFNIIKSLSATQDAISCFSCDLKLNNDDNDDSLDILSTTDYIRDENILDLSKSYSNQKRNNKVNLLRDLTFSNRLIPNKTFIKDPSQRDKLSLYEREPFFYNIPRMLRGCSLFKASGNLFNSELFSSSNWKSIYGDISDSIIGLNCLLKRSKLTTVSIGSDEAFINYYNNEITYGDIIVSLVYDSNMKNNCNNLTYLSFLLNNPCREHSLDNILNNYLVNTKIIITQVTEDNDLLYCFNPGEIIFFVALRIENILKGFNFIDSFNNVISFTISLILSTYDESPLIRNLSNIDSDENLIIINTALLFQLDKSTNVNKFEYLQSNNIGISDSTIPNIINDIKSHENIEKNFIEPLKDLISSATNFQQLMVKS